VFGEAPNTAGEARALPITTQYRGASTKVASTVYLAKKGGPCLADEWICHSFSSDFRGRAMAGEHSHIVAEREQFLPDPVD
jgi:hypothetical protein